MAFLSLLDAHSRPAIMPTKSKGRSPSLSIAKRGRASHSLESGAAPGAFIMRREIISLTSEEPSGAVTNIPSAAESDRTPSAEAGRECSAAFAKIYQRYYDRILRLALRITRNLQDAEDVAHDCFVHSFLHLGSFAGKSRLSTWISRIAINDALMKIRRRGRFEVSLDERRETPSAAPFTEIACDDPAPEEQCLKAELAQMLTEGLAELRPGLSKVVDLHYFEELSARECSEVLGISLSTAKSRILRARLRLRLAFDKRFRRPIAPFRLHPNPRCSFQSRGRETARRACAAATPIRNRRHA